MLDAAMLKELIYKQQMTINTLRLDKSKLLDEIFYLNEQIIDLKSNLNAVCETYSCLEE